MFTAISSLIYIILCCVTKKTSNTIVFALILEVADMIVYDWDFTLIMVSVFNVILLVAAINGITKAKGEMYLAEKYDESHNIKD